MKKLFITLILLICLAAFGYSQTLTATIGTDSAFAGDSVLVPLNVTGFDNIGTMEFQITFDHSVLTYASLQDINSNMLGVSGNDNGKVLIITWITKSESGVNFGNTTLFKIKFKLDTGSTYVCFDTINNRSMAADNTTLTYDKVKWTCGEVQQTSVEVNEININTNLKVFPNPAINILSIYYQGYTEKNKTMILFYNITGELIKMLQIQNAFTEVNISDLAQGVYIVKIVSENCVRVKKMIKE